MLPGGMVLRLINWVLYAALATFGLASISPHVIAAARALVRPFSYAPNLVWPWLWLLLAAGVTGLLADATRRMLRGSRVGLRRYASLLVLVGLCLGARRMLEPPARPSVTDALEHLVARVELEQDAAYARDKRYVTDAAQLQTVLPARLAEMGYFRRGLRRLHSQVHVVSPSAEPVLRAPDDVRPGDLVVALDSRARRYWITPYRLDARGRVAPLLDPRGRVVVASAADGRATSRLDPLFPDYPRRNPTRPKAPSENSTKTPDGGP